MSEGKFSLFLGEEHVFRLDVSDYVVPASNAEVLVARDIKIVSFEGIVIPRWEPLPVRTDCGSCVVLFNEAKTVVVGHYSSGDSDSVYDFPSMLGYDCVRLVRVVREGRYCNGSEVCRQVCILDVHVDLILGVTEILYSVCRERLL